MIQIDTILTFLIIYRDENMRSTHGAVSLLFSYQNKKIDYH